MINILLPTKRKKVKLRGSGCCLLFAADTNGRAASLKLLQNEKQ